MTTVLIEDSQIKNNDDLFKVKLRDINLSESNLTLLTLF